MGSASTLKAALYECESSEIWGIEKNKEYFKLAENDLRQYLGLDSQNLEILSKL